MNPRTTVLIAEDEPLAAEALAEWVTQLPQLQLLATCGDGETALAEARRLQPDLVLMDIQMPGLTGLQVLRALAAEGARPAVIFTTAYDEHAVTAFELHAIDYLLKPFSHERFLEAVAHAVQASRPALDVTLEALVRLPITTFEQRLDPARFLKLHRGCMVNLDFVESMTPDESSQLVVKMRDGTQITASRDVSKKLRDQAI